MAAETEQRTIGFHTAAGERVYAVGDVHGCRRALEQLIRKMRLDAESRPPTVTRIILLGDLIDRGPDSADVVRAVMALTRSSDRFTVLMGNHEQLMVRALNGDLEALALWLNVGAAETLRSFGVDKALVREGSSARLLSAAQKAIGVGIVAWLASLPLLFRSGQVVFVHAGLRPGISLERQSPEDLLWIREPFLSGAEDLDVFVVHGHTISREGPSWRERRVGIDTGAYETGRLTALGLEAGSAWVLST